jgi:uncharacterized membrane protein
MPRTIVGLFDTLAEAQDAAQDMLDSGIPTENISLVAADPQEASAEVRDPQPASTMTAEAEHGALVGGLSGLMLGVGELAVPDIGPAVVGGWLAAALLGAGVGAIAGGVIGSLAGSGISHEEAGELTESVRSGATLLAIRTGNTCVPSVIDLLHRRHAAHIHCREQP